MERPFSEERREKILEPVPISGVTDGMVLGARAERASMALPLVSLEGHDSGCGGWALQRCRKLTYSQVPLLRY